MPIRFSRQAKWVTVALVVLLAILLLRAVTHILLPFIWAIIIAYIFNPLIRVLTQRTTIRRGVWVTALYIILLGTMTLLLTALVPLLIQQFNGLVDATTQQGGFLDQVGLYFAQKEAVDLGFGLRIDVQEIEQELVDTIKAYATGLTAAVPDLFVTVVEGFIHLLVFLVSTFYLLLHAERISSGFYNMIPERHRGEIRALVHSIDRVLGAYIRGQLILIVLMSTLSFIVLIILDVRFALIIAIATGILEIIPIVGPYLATSIAALVALLGGSTPFGMEPWMAALIVVICYFALRQMEDHLVIPALIGHIVDLHPVVVLFSILAGGVLAGALGLLIAIPIAAVIKIILVYLYKKLIDAPVATLGPPDDQNHDRQQASSSVETTSATTATS